MIQRWSKMLLAILIGNILYFLLLPALPDALQHDTFKVDWGLLLDFVFCALVYQAVSRI